MADLPRTPITRQEEYLSRLAGENTTLPREPITREEMYLEGAIARVEAVEEEVEEIKSNPDVVDVVGTYQDLQDYDTSTLTDKDIIRVLEDSTHSDNSTYYRWDASASEFEFVGEIAGGGDSIYSTKTTSNQSDGGAVFIGPLNASQIPLPDPTTTDNHYRYFWAMPFDVSGQDNFGIPGSETINIGGKQNGSSFNTTVGYRAKVLGGDSNTVLGFQAEARGFSSNVVIGDSAKSYVGSAVVIGRDAQTSFNGTVALGSFSQPTRMGEVNVGTSQSSYGYNSTNYRVIGGVHDPVDAHDAATKGYVDAKSGQPTKFYLNSDTIVSDMQLYKDASYTTSATAQDVVDSFLNNNAIIVAVGGSVYPTGYYHAMIYKIAYIDDWKEDGVITPYFYDEDGNKWYIDTNGKIGESNN